MHFFRGATIKRTWLSARILFAKSDLNTEVLRGGLGWRRETCASEIAVCVKHNKRRRHLQFLPDFSELMVRTLCLSPFRFPRRRSKGSRADPFLARKADYIEVYRSGRHDIIGENSSQPHLFPRQKATPKKRTKPIIWTKIGLKRERWM